MATVNSSLSLSKRLRISRSANKPPRPVAASLPSEPPAPILLPVKAALDVSPVSFSNSSTIQSIMVALVLTSGAGTSLSGPMCGARCAAYLRDSSSSSSLVSSLGFTDTPPLPPPNGRPTAAVFSVISVASARTSSRPTSG